jgi:hypothetical protein
MYASRTPQKEAEDRQHSERNKDLCFAIWNISACAGFIAVLITARLMFSKDPSHAYLLKV